MPPGKDSDTLQILVQIAGDIGETRGDIASLKENVGSITDDFREVKEQLAQTVTKPECTQRHVVVAQSLDAMKKDILAELKKPSGMHQAITPEMLRAAAAPTLQEIEEALNQKKEEVAEKKRRAVTFWLATLSAGAALLGGTAVGVYKLVIFMSKLENAVSIQSDEMKSEIRRAKNVVYVRLPANVDRGIVVPPKRVPSKKRER